MEGQLTIASVAQLVVKNSTGYLKGLKGIICNLSEIKCLRSRDIILYICLSYELKLFATT